MNTLKLIVWPQQVVEVAKVLLEKNQQVIFEYAHHFLLKPFFKFFTYEKNHDFSEKLPSEG